jgi:hypothetical protein
MTGVFAMLLYGLAGFISVLLVRCHDTRAEGFAWLTVCINGVLYYASSLTFGPIPVWGEALRLHGLIILIATLLYRRASAGVRSGC